MDATEIKPYIFSCDFCGCMMSDGEWRLDNCLNCNKKLVEEKISNYKNCDNCRKYYLVDCNTYFCSSCGEFLKPMSYSIYCICGQKNDVINNNCISCSHPLSLNSYYNSYRDCRDVFHQTKGLSSEKFCSYCGARKTISPKSQSKTRCVICMAKKAEYVFIPCGHLCCCKDCKNIDFNDSCPLCRSSYKGIFKIYT